MGRSHLKASTIAALSVTSDTETNLFQNLAPQSTLAIAPDSVRVGDIFRLRIIFFIQPVSTSVVSFNYTHRNAGVYTTIMNTTESKVDISVTQADNYVIECDITFNTLETANIVWESAAKSSLNSKFSYVPNSPFDEHLEQTFGLTTTATGVLLYNVQEITLTKLTFT